MRRLTETVKMIGAILALFAALAAAYMLLWLVYLFLHPEYAL